MSATGAETPTSASRTSNPESLGPIPIFDVNLRVISESYLTFFQERKKIEESYVDALTRLHRKTKQIDAYLDDRGDMSTTRSAWNEVRDNVEREVQSRQAFIATLTVDVLNPLNAFKETQDRTRKRIKEDLKDSITAYNEYAENVLPKLKRIYLKKCQEVEDHKTAAAASQASAASEQNSLVVSRSNPSSQIRPVVTAPQPLRPLERRASGSAPTTRNRSPSSTTAFSDLAHQGKKQLNQLIGFLDKGGNAKELGGRSDNNSLRAVRSKREADEADKDYRRGVHWLETLRLRRTKILEGGYKSLEMLIEDSALTLKKILESYTDNMAATSETQTHLSAHARNAVNKISPEKDVQNLSTIISRSLALAIPKPQLYYNFQVGECNDLIFGVSLVDYATARGLQDGDIPKIVRLCIKEVDQRGLESEGIYRVSGRHAVVQALQHKIERNEKEFAFNPLTEDVYAVSTLLKLYLRELPEPVFRFSLQDRILHTGDIAEHQSNNFMVLRAKMRRLPAIHQATLKAIVEHLSRVIAFRDKNKMDAKNLAIVFGGIFGEDEMPKGGDLLNMQSWKDSLMEDLITNAHALFDENAAQYYSPLPPTPAGPPPIFTYGTAHTRMGSVPATPNSRTHPEDFTPKLPARPTDSIHPSLRAGVQQPPREQGVVPLSPTYAAEKNTEALPLPPLTPSDDNDSDDRDGVSDVVSEAAHETAVISPTASSPTKSTHAMESTDHSFGIDTDLPPAI